MKINVASKNPVKINAVRELIKDYDFLVGAEVSESNVNSYVNKQPKSLNETVRGAINRAKNAFQNCELSFGIEGGLIEVPETKTGFMNTTFCAIYDGKNIHLGMGCGFEMPAKAIEL